MALRLRGLQSHTLRCCFNRAGPPRHPHRGRIADGTTRARCGEGPVPKHSRERGERPELHPHIADGGAASPARAFPRQDACCTPLPRHYPQRTGLMMRMGQVMKEELADECDYTREAACLRSFGSPEKLGSDPRFKVPWVWEGSTDRVLVMEYVEGASVGGDAVHSLPQEDRDEVRSLHHTRSAQAVEANMIRLHEDSHARDRSLPARALRLPRDADGPQLVQLSLERENAPGGGTFISFLSRKTLMHVLDRTGGLWRDAELQRYIHGQLVPLASRRDTARSGRVPAVELGARLSHWRGERCRSLHL